jgi:hypothetical protein
MVGNPNLDEFPIKNGYFGRYYKPFSASPDEKGFLADRYPKAIARIQRYQQHSIAQGAKVILQDE